MYFRNYFHLEIFPYNSQQSEESKPPASAVFKKRKLELWRCLHRARVGARMNQFRFSVRASKISTQRSVQTFSETISDERTQHPW
jgi:hypothetical protein